MEIPFELGVGGEGQDTYRHFESGFGSVFTNYHQLPEKFFYIFLTNLSFISFEHWLFVASVSGAPPLVGLRGAKPPGIFLGNKLKAGAF